MTAEIINLPARPERPVTQSEVDQLHAEAFRDLEPLLCDCVSMAKIAADHVANAKTDDREMVFAGMHVFEMLSKLKEDYYAAWHGEKTL